MSKERIIHFVLSPGDSDLIAWRDSLPQRQFNKLVNEILSAEYKGKIATIPCKFSSTKVTADHHYRLIIRDVNARWYLKQFGWGEVTENIKKVIRKHIKKNQSIEKSANYELLIDVLNRTRIKINLKTDSTRGTEFRNKKLIEAYDKVIRKIFSSINECYAGDENQGDVSLGSLDCNKLVDEIFDSVFAAPTEPATQIADENKPEIEVVYENEPDDEVLVEDDNVDFGEYFSKMFFTEKYDDIE